MSFFNFYRKSKPQKVTDAASDYFEASAWSDYDYKILNKDIEIDYTDMNGQQTIRNHYGRHISGDAFVKELTKYIY